MCSEPGISLEPHRLMPFKKNFDCSEYNSLSRLFSRVVLCWEGMDGSFCPVRQSSCLFLISVSSAFLCQCTSSIDFGCLYLPRERDPGNCLSLCRSHRSPGRADPAALLDLYNTYHRHLLIIPVSIHIKGICFLWESGGISMFQRLVVFKSALATCLYLRVVVL